MSKLLTETAAEKIKERIISGEFPPGSKLPTETELIEYLQVSRTTVREAIKILKSSGFVTIRRGIGTFVESAPGVSDDPLGLKMFPEEKRVLDLLELRLLLEPQAAMLACDRATEEDLEKLRLCALETHTAYATLQSDQDDQALNGAMMADVAFHSALLAASHNYALARMIPFILESMTQNYRNSDYCLSQMHSTRPETHHKIATLIAEKNKEAVAKVCSEHIQSSIRALTPKNE